MSDETPQWNDYPKQILVSAQMSENGGHLALFQQFPIRRTWHGGNGGTAWSIAWGH